MVKMFKLWLLMQFLNIVEWERIWPWHPWKDWWQQFGVALNQHVFEIIDSSQFGKQIED